MYSQKRNGHRQQGHMEFMAGDPDLDRLQTPVTQVCDASLPDLLSDFYARFDALKDSTTTQWPGSLHVLSQREENHIQDQSLQGCWTWQYTWTCTQTLCRTTKRCPQCLFTLPAVWKKNPSQLHQTTASTPRLSGYWMHCMLAITVHTLM